MELGGGGGSELETLDRLHCSEANPKRRGARGCGGPWRRVHGTPATPARAAPTAAETGARRCDRGLWAPTRRVRGMSMQRINGPRLVTLPRDRTRDTRRPTRSGVLPELLLHVV